MRHVVFVERYRTETTNVFTAVSQTPSAGIGYFVTADGTFVARDFYYFDNVFIVLVPAHSEFDSFFNDCSFFIDTATHGRNGPRNDDFGHVQNTLEKFVVPGKTSDFTQYFIFKMLYFCIEFTHSFPLKIDDLYTLFHFLQAGGKFFYKVHFYIEVYGKIGVLVSGVDCPSYKEIDIGRFFE